MPIKNLSDKRRLPRLGKIHLGIKKANDKGVEYPSAVDYFVCPPEVEKIFGEKPKELRIVFPIEDIEKLTSQYYRAYSQTRGLICKGDGENCTRMVAKGTERLATHEDKEVENIELSCNGQDCEYYGKKCKELMCLQFVIPEVPGLGIYQLDTSSINSIININSAIELIQRTVGHISGIPLKLVLETIEVALDGKKKNIHVLNLKIDLVLNELKGVPSLPAPEVELPVSDDEVPELLMPENQAPQEDEPVKIRHLGDLLTICHKRWGMNRQEVLAEGNITDGGNKLSVASLNQAFLQIRAVRE